MRPSVLFFPGLAQDARALDLLGPWPFPVRAQDPIAPERGESLADYARRWSETISPSVRSTVLVGLSFGAAIALELAGPLRAGGVVLLSGLRSGVELSPLLRAVGRRAPRLPRWTDAASDALAPWATHWVGRVDRAQRVLATSLWREFPKPWMREQARMCAEWGGCAQRVPVLRIHGTSDPVLPPRRVQGVDLWLPRERHLFSPASRDRLHAHIEAFVSRIAEVRDVQSSR